jgi:hypothetical protein
MKKTATSMILIAIVTLSTALPAEAGGRRYYKNNNNNNVNGWAAAAIGAVVGVAIGSAIANNQSPNYTYTQPNYNNQDAPQYYAPQYSAPQYSAPQYYAPQQACMTTQVPVYNQFGQTVQYRQICAN